MATVTLPTTSQGTSDTNLFADVKDNDQAIIDQINGNLDATNLASGAVTTTKIADLNVTSGKLASGAALANLGAAGVPDANLASPNNSAYRTLLQAGGYVGFHTVAGTYILGTTAVTGFLVASGATAIDGSGNSTPTNPPLINFDDADYTVTGLTQKLRLRTIVTANATAPAITFTFGLYPLTVAGGTDLLVYTLGSVVASSTVAMATPSASTVTRSNNSDFTIPADGAYALGVVTSGTIAANSLVSLHATLQTRNV